MTGLEEVKAAYDVCNGTDIASDVARPCAVSVITFNRERLIPDLRDIPTETLFRFVHSDDVWAQDIFEPASSTVTSRLSGITIRSPQGPTCCW